jgi:hypothetical protein
MKDSSPPVCGKPAAVSKAVMLLYTSLAIGVVNFLLFIYWSLNMQGDLGTLAIGMFAAYAFMVWLIYNIDEGYNWARITLLVIFLIGLPIHIRALVNMLSFSYICDGLGLSKDGLQIVAFTFLFGRGARPWFCPVKSDPPLTPDGPNPNA